MIFAVERHMELQIMNLLIKLKLCHTIITVSQTTSIT